MVKFWQRKHDSFSSRKESFQRQEQDEFGNNRGMVSYSEYEKTRNLTGFGIAPGAQIMPVI